MKHVYSELFSDGKLIQESMGITGENLGYSSPEANGRVQGRWLFKRLPPSLGHISKRSNLQPEQERAFWHCLTLSQRLKIISDLKKSELVADRVFELPLELISLYPLPFPHLGPFLATCLAHNVTDWNSWRERHFRAVLSSDCEILASKFPVLSKPMKQAER